MGSEWGWQRKVSMPRNFLNREEQFELSSKESDSNENQGILYTRDKRDVQECAFVESVRFCWQTVFFPRCTGSSYRIGKTMHRCAPSESLHWQEPVRLYSRYDPLALHFIQERLWTTKVSSGCHVINCPLEEYGEASGKYRTISRSRDQTKSGQEVWMLYLQYHPCSWRAGLKSSNTALPSWKTFTVFTIIVVDPFLNLYKSRQGITVRRVVFGFGCLTRHFVRQPDI